MSRMKKWSELEGQPLSFDVNSTTEEAMQDTEHPSRIHMTTDGRVVMNGVILGDRNPQRGKWDGRVVINKAVPCYARAGMAYYFSDGDAKFKINKEQFDECNSSFGTQTPFQAPEVWVYDNADNYAQMSIISKYKDTGLPTVSQLCSLKEKCANGISVVLRRYNDTPIIVLVKKDGNIFEEGKYKIIELVGNHTVQPRSPHYIIRGNRIFFIKNPLIRTYTESHAGINYTNENTYYNPLTWRYKYTKPRRCFDNDSKYWKILDGQRRTVMRLFTAVKDNFTCVLYPTYKDRRGRRTIAELGSWLCHIYGRKYNIPGAGVRIEPLRRVYTKKGNYLR